jgi:hypothetical protein
MTLVNFTLNSRHQCIGWILLGTTVQLNNQGAYNDKKGHESTSISMLCTTLYRLIAV